MHSFRDRSARPIGVVAALLSALAAPTPAVAESTLSGAPGHWQQERVESRSAEFPPHPCYARTYSGGQGDATVTSKLTCGNNPWTGTTRAAWSTPPAFLVPGQNVQVSIAARASATHSGITAGATIDARFDTQRCGYTQNAIKLVEVIVASHDPARQALEKTGSAVVPGFAWSAGVKEFSGRLLLKICMPGWQTHYWYVWKPGAPPPASATIFKPAKVPPKPESPTAATTPPKIPMPSYWNPKWEDSGARFSDLSGQVEWRPDDDEEAWRFAKLGDILPVDAHIKTSEKSQAMLSFADMTVFVMKPESEIVLSSPAAKDSEVKLLAGNLWTNIKKMMKDGSLEIEMSQAVAGIKGTIFSSSARPGVSEVAVCEGTVILTHKRTRKAIALNAGDKGLATENDLQRIQVGPKIICDEYASALRPDPAKTGIGTPTVIFDNGNGFGIEVGAPTRPTIFTLATPHRITQIKNYHWHGGGRPAGQISLVGPAGLVGTWKATGLPGSGRSNVYWVVHPNVTLPAGTYTIRDSDPSTWAQNAQSKRTGMTHVEGHPVK